MTCSAEIFDHLFALTGEEESIPVSRRRVAALKKALGL
jgi:DNA-binding LytR/AlgR family response regulator